MIQFPETTEYGKRMPKEKFYAHLEVSAGIKRSFVNELEQIVWRNKLSASTLNIASGEMVKEIALLEVRLKTRNYNWKLFEWIDRNIPIYVIYLLQYGTEASLLVNYKEPVKTNLSGFKVVETYCSEWQAEDQLDLRLEGLNLDTLYRSFVRQIVGKEWVKADGDEEFAEQINRQMQLKKIDRQIIQLEAKLLKEVQFNRQIVLAGEIKKLKKLRAQIYG